MLLLKKRTSPMAVRLRAVVATTVVAAVITAVVTWKDTLRDFTNNNRESAQDDAFSRFCSCSYAASFLQSQTNNTVIIKTT